MPDPFARLHEALLRGGMSPARARRAATELREHFADIVDELVDGGVATDVADHLAARRLGDLDLFATQLLADRRALGFAHRFPLLAWLAPPLAAFIALTVAAAALLVTAGRAGWPLDGLAAGLGLLLLAAPLLTCWIVAGFALRRRTGWPWPLAGMVLTLLAGAALRLDVLPSAVGVTLTAPAPGPLAVSALLAILPVVVIDRLHKVF